MKFSKYPGAYRLQEAIQSGRIFQTRILLESGADLQFVDEEGLSPILLACKVDQTKRRTRTSLIRLLIQHGADVNATDPQGRHALMVSCISASVDIVRLLLNTSIHNVNLNLKDRDGNTALMHAVRSESTEIVSLLVDALNKFQLDVDVRNNDDYTPYLEAKRLGNEECAQILATVGHASRNIQVNPFLDFLHVKEIENDKEGGIRSRASDSTVNGSDFKQNRRVVFKRQNKLRDISKIHSTKPKGDILKKMEDEQLSYRKKDITLKNKTAKGHLHIYEKKFAWHEKPSIKENEESLTQLSKDCSNGTMSMVENKKDLSEGYTEMSNQTSRDKTELTVEDATFSHAHPCPSSLSNDMYKKSEFGLSEVSPRSDQKDSSPANQPETFLTSSLLNEKRCKFRTANPNLKCDRPRSASVKSEVSWCTHFSKQESTSAAFIHRLMSLYAEQISPQSSYRSGLSHRQIVPPSTVSDDEELDRRSSCCSKAGSIRTSTPVGIMRSSSRKFSKTVASFLNNRRAMATVAILKSGLKDGGTC